MALALTRKPGQRVTVGNPPFGTIEVVSIVAGQVKLSFNFPRNVLILREEVPPTQKPNADPQAQIDGHGLELADDFVLKLHEVGDMPKGWVECDRCGRIGAANHTHITRVDPRDGTSDRQCFRCWPSQKELE